MKRTAVLFFILALSTFGQTIPSTNKLTFTVTQVTNPVPGLTSISPSSAQAGGVGFTLTVTGSNFISSSVVNWNGVAKTTTFVSPTQLTVSLAAADIAVAGNIPVSVTTPAPGGGTTGNLTFQVTQAAPTLTTLSPTSTAAGTPGISITITGTGFVSGSAARWDGTGVTTSFVSSTKLTITVPAAWLTTAGTHQIDVVNPAPAPPAPVAINPVTPPPATLGQQYTLQLSATGGLPPYTWSVVSGTLPAGLTLASTTGLISGVATGSSSSFTVQVMDSTGASASIGIGNNAVGGNDAKSI